MEGLLNFIKTPEGQGLLSATFGGLAGARRGQPLNSLGRAGLAGLTGYGDALERQQQVAEAAQAKELRDMQMQEMRDKLLRTTQIREAAQGAMTPALPGMGSLNDALPPELRAPTVAAKPAGFDTQGFVNRIMTIDPLMGLDFRQKLIKEPKYTTLKPGEVLVDERDPTKPVYSVPAESKPMEIERLLDAAGIVDPKQRAAFLTQALTKQTTHTPAVQNINMGSPVPIELPGGGTGYAQPANRPGAAPQIMVDPTSGKPLTKPKNDGNVPAEIQRMNLAGRTMATLLDDYAQFLDKNNPRDPMVQMNPELRAKMQSMNRNIQLQFKELQALGALAGPDLAIMESALSNPFSPQGVFFGPKGLKAQIDQARQLIRLRTQPADTSNGNTDPLGVRGK